MFINRERGMGMLLHIFIVLELVGISNSFNFYEPARIPGWNYFGYTWPQPKPSVVFRKPMAAMVDLTNDLGVAILQDYSYSRSNFAFSPYGVASVLVVLYEGARGESARQIHRAVKFPWDRDITRVGFRDIHRHLRSYFSHEGYLSGITLSKEGSSLKPEYKRILRFYGYDVDVDSPERTTDSLPSATTEKVPSSSNSYETSTPSATTTSGTNGNDITTAKGIDSEETNIATTTINSEGNSTLAGDETTTTSTATTLEIESENTQVPEMTSSSQGSSMEATTEEAQTIQVPETTSLRGSSSLTTTPEEEQTTQPPETTSSRESTITSTDVEQSETTQVFETSSKESSTGEQAHATQLPVTTTARERWSTMINAGQEETLSVVTESLTTVTEPSSELSYTTRQVVTEATTDSSATDTTATSSYSIGLETTTDEGEELTSTSIVEELAAVKKESLPEALTGEDMDRKLNYEAFDNGMLIPQESNYDARSSLLFDVPDKRNTIGKESSLTEWEEVGGTLVAEGDRVKWEPKSLDQFLSDLISFANGTRMMNQNKRFASEKPRRGRRNSSRGSQGLNETKKYLVKGSRKWSTRKMRVVDFETCAQMKRRHSTKEKRTISEFLKIPGGVTDLSLQLQNGMFDSHVSKDSDLYRALPKFLFLVDGAIDTPVPMMSYANFFPYSYIPRLHCKALEFPLDDERYKLLILLPVERRGLRQLIYDLSSYPLRDITDVLRPTRVKAMVPTFMVEGFVILTPTLQKLGIWDVFDPRRSNLSGMSTDPELYVRNIEQSVTVVIRNYVEILDIQTRTMAARNIEEEFIASHPFLYFVMDTTTNVALMAGQMLDPLNSRIY